METKEIKIITHEQSEATRRQINDAAWVFENIKQNGQDANFKMIAEITEAGPVLSSMPLYVEQPFVNYAQSAAVAGLVIENLKSDGIIVGAEDDEKEVKKETKKVSKKTEKKKDEK